MKAARAFTLIEVLVALVIVAFAVGALMSALTSAAGYAGRQRDSSIAQWIAFNQIATVRLGLQQPAAGASTGELDYGPAHWSWEQSIDDIDIPGVRRITVKVRRAGDLGVTGRGNDNAPWLVTATGFKGDALNASSGQSVNWNGRQNVPGGAVAGAAAAGGSTQVGGGSSSGSPQLPAQPPVQP
jgi:general secretion pathway protein I